MNKAIFVFANYGLIDHKHDAGEGYDAFRVLLSNQEKDAAGEESSLPTLRRGRRIMDDAPSRLRVRANLTMPLPSRGPREVKWNLPTGFALGKEPAKLDDSLVGKWIYLRLTSGVRWKGYGWQLGKIYTRPSRASRRGCS